MNNLICILKAGTRLLEPGMDVKYIVHVDTLARIKARYARIAEQKK